MLWICWTFKNLRNEQSKTWVFLQSQVMIHHPTNLKCTDCSSTAPQTATRSSRLLWDILGHLQEYSCGNSSRHQQQRFLAWRVRKMLVVSCILGKMCKVVWADPPATHLRFLWEVGCDYQHDWCSTCVLYCYSSKSYEIRLKNPLKILKKLNTQTCCMTGSLGKGYPRRRDKRNEAGVTRIKKAGMHRSVPTATGCNGR